MASELAYFGTTFLAGVVVLVSMIPSTRIKVSIGVALVVTSVVNILIRW